MTWFAVVELQSTSYTTDMYFKLVIAVLFLVSVTSTTGCESCEPGEVFTTCGTCDGSCANPNPICTLQCRVGCYCTSGNVRDSQGRCIPYEQC